ncbi:MAG: hypothetical protein J0H68_01345 [Sphingobacteriia bacterium]|nr:hypothetical protein [Sphingobacteriia bacterium]
MSIHRRAAEILYSFYFKENNSNYYKIIDKLNEFLKKLPLKRTINYTFNFAYQYLSEAHKNDIESILNTKILNILPEMWIFRDGEIHFNNVVHIYEKPIFKQLTLKKFEKLKSEKNIRMFKGFSVLTVDKLVVSDKHYSIGYGSKKIHIFPGNWIMVIKDYYYVLDRQVAHKKGIYGIVVNENSEPVSSKPYYPGDILLKEITKNPSSIREKIEKSEFILSK